MKESIEKQLEDLNIKIEDTAIELGYVLKAIEELAVEKEFMTRGEIQNKIIDLADRGWKPEVLRANDESV